ncbi:hypothetical protein ITP53_25675 [Nonomuraea sp. K274]|uniref:Acetyltransferase (GNAT) family protein n=1 Tax=Nonomuraea cypriaca TaxID=1187855 RepID=A0A931AEJ9_9ACTN|nr:hypothetical protein [Nonomuraea cypriaca]MBF8189063.1 hypothetical protein [Nonomuraea cypriaca]
MIRELRAAGEVRPACGDDDLVMWLAQGMTGQARAWALGDAVVVACPWVSAELVAAHGRAALMVDDDNTAAIGVYERIGYRRVMAARAAG